MYGEANCLIIFGWLSRCRFSEVELRNTSSLHCKSRHYFTTMKLQRQRVDIYSAGPACRGG